MHAGGAVGGVGLDAVALSGTDQIVSAYAIPYSPRPALAVTSIPSTPLRRLFDASSTPSLLFDAFER
jgi:hypothetical protein